MSRTKPLHDLQLLDQQHDAAQSRLQRIEQALGRTPAVAAAQAALEAREAERTRVDDALAACQAKRRALRERMASEEAQLYSGRTVSAREIEGQKANLDAHGRLLATLDDEALRLMLERDAAEEAAGAAQRALDEASAAAATTQAQLHAAHIRLGEGLAGLAPRRLAARALVPPADLALYDRLRGDAKRGGIAVAKVANEACGGCGRTLTSAETQRATAALAQCPTCGRILHV